MTKFFKNLYRLIIIGTPLFIILNYIKNFLPNYKTKKKSNILEKNIYNNFISYNENEKWFCNNLNYLNNYFNKIDNIEKILEIGSYEGRSAIFFLKTFPFSKISCIDTWRGSDEHSNYNFNIIEQNFDKNTFFYQKNKRLKKIKDTSNNFFKKNSENFDLIYVDGDHASEQVSLDIINSWKILNKGGFLILDDYLWWYYKELDKNPSSPINNFITNNLSEISFLKVWQQVIIKKID